jgi:Raf kinase inhibitor-like YbhB/YbcL family protein
MTLRLESPSFDEGYPIPPRYTCDGYDISPPIAWYGAPDGAASLALICEDPDAPRGTFCHWIVYNIPTSRTHFEEDVPKRIILNDGMRQGVNDFGNPGYGGPCPPKNHHRYFFRLYALDSMLDLVDDVGMEAFRRAIHGHVLDEAVLCATYGRKHVHA